MNVNIKTDRSIKKMVAERHLIARTVSVIIAVITMGFALSFLVLVDMGTDPCTALNLAVAEKVGLSIGNWQAIFNTCLFILVIIFGRKYIGIGTVANMYLVGYSLEFFRWVWKQCIPLEIFENMGVRIAVLIPALFVFIIAAAVYMDVKLGTAPYDAIAFIISDRLPKVSIKILRIVYDMTFIVIAFILGNTVGLVTLLIAFTLGPAIGYVGEFLAKKWDVFK